MTEQPKIPPKVRMFMEIFEKMGVSFVDKDGNPILANDDTLQKRKNQQNCKVYFTKMKK